MSGQPYLDWPAVSLSLFNAFLLFWLGFTILLESDRKSLWYLAGCGWSFSGSGLFHSPFSHS